MTLTNLRPVTCFHPFFLSPKAVDELKRGNIPVDKAEDVARLVAHAMAVDLGEDMPSDEEASR